MLWVVILVALGLFASLVIKAEIVTKTVPWVLLGVDTDVCLPGVVIFMLGLDVCLLVLPHLMC
jgi:hypothetical protein